MPPLPPIWDPAKAVDRLPQPFRMIDKIVAEVVEKALDICLAKEKHKRVVKDTHIEIVRRLAASALFALTSSSAGHLLRFIQHSRPLPTP